MKTKLTDEQREVLEAVNSPRADIILRTDLGNKVYLVWSESEATEDLHGNFYRNLVRKGWLKTNPAWSGKSHIFHNVTPAGREALNED